MVFVVFWSMIAPSASRVLMRNGTVGPVRGGFLTPSTRRTPRAKLAAPLERVRVRVGRPSTTLVARPRSWLAPPIVTHVAVMVLRSYPAGNCRTILPLVGQGLA